MYIDPAEVEAERFIVHTNEKHQHSVIQICLRFLYNLVDDPSNPELCWKITKNY